MLRQSLLFALVAVALTFGSFAAAHAAGPRDTWRHGHDRVERGTHGGQGDPSVHGKYSTLLRKLKVDQDRAAYSDFNDYGYYPATDYAGYTGIPAGYWVYVYPYWYVWADVNNP
jgi:hypothetical protein